MFFACKNCGGNIVYNPEKHKMVCPFCESEETQERKESSTYGENICPNCGGEVPLEVYASAAPCPFCGTSMIVDSKVEGEYTPKKILPFQLGKEACKNLFRKRFGKVLFAPADLLDEARLDSIHGMYVPYWLYDYDTTISFRGEGTKTKIWYSGNTEYTEVSYYSIVRDIDVNYRMVPADASNKMPDDVMNLIEPYDYNKFEEFNPEFMSGFTAEIYNMPASDLESRAKSKASDSAVKLLKNSYSQYNSVKTYQMNVNYGNEQTSYSLLPVWIYEYNYKDRPKFFYVNGQTGKVVGQVPISQSKAWIFTGTFFASITSILMMALYLIFG